MDRQTERNREREPNIQRWTERQTDRQVPSKFNFSILHSGDILKVKHTLYCKTNKIRNYGWVHTGGCEDRSDDDADDKEGKQEPCEHRHPSTRTSLTPLPLDIPLSSPATPT